MKKAFTLIELLIVIAILGALALLITGNFFTSLKKGRDARRKADLEQIRQALEVYYEDKKAYPTAAPTPGFPFGGKFCETSGCASGEQVYMQKVSNDPVSSRDYSYEYDATTGGYRLNACLENDLQVLPYQSSTTAFTCTTNCEYDSNQVPCIWSISSSNITP